MKIKTIKKIESQSKRYDIEVEKNHNFYANGILVHNCQNKKSLIDSCFQEGLTLMGTIKRDGSSFTAYYVDDSTFGICSRNNGKSLDQTYVRTYKDGDILLHPYVEREYFPQDRLSKIVRFWRSLFGLSLKSYKMKGWYNDDTRTFYTEEQAGQKFEAVMGERRNAWVDVNKEYGYLDKLINYCRENKVKLALRGELIGQGNKGSGKSVNSDAKLKAQVIWFGVDNLESGFSKRAHYGEQHNLKTVCETLSLDYTKPVFEGVYDYDSLIKECHRIFDEHKKATGITLEGIVIRTTDSNKLSVKYINPKYDVF